MADCVRRVLSVYVAASFLFSTSCVTAPPAPPPAPTRAPAPPNAGPPNGLEALTFNPDVIPIPPNGQPLRFSLCEWRTLGPNEESRQCDWRNATAVHGGHPAPYVFNTGNTFLPKGLHLDGNGILYGTPEGDLSKQTVHLCALQLNQNADCWNVGFGDTRVAQQPAGKEPAAGGGGDAMLVLLVLGGLGLGGAYAYQQYQNQLQSNGGGDGGPKQGQCDGTSSRNACGACTCGSSYGDCTYAGDCGGGGCWVGQSKAPFCH